MGREDPEHTVPLGRGDGGDRRRAQELEICVINAPRQPDPTQFPYVPCLSV